MHDCMTAVLVSCRFGRILLVFDGLSTCPADEQCGRWSHWVCVQNNNNGTLETWRAQGAQGLIEVQGFWDAASSRHFCSSWPTVESVLTCTTIPCMYQVIWFHQNHSASSRHGPGTSCERLKQQGMRVRCMWSHSGTCQASSQNALSASSEVFLFCFLSLKGEPFPAQDPWKYLDKVSAAVQIVVGSWKTRWNLADMEGS